MNTTLGLHEWFKVMIQPKLSEKADYVFNYRHYDDGDFGDLDQVAFDSDAYLCEIDFWSSGWLSLGVWDVLQEKVVINEFLEPTDITEQRVAWIELFKVLEIHSELPPHLANLLAKPCNLERQ